MTPSDPTPTPPDDLSATVPNAPPPPVDAVPDAPADAPPPVPEGEAPPAAEGEAPPAKPQAAEAPRVREPALPSQPVPDVPPAPQPHDLSRIAQDLQIRKAQVEAVVQLLDEDNTVPFITRYRKERTGGLNEEVIRRIQDRVANLRGLADRKQTILKSIAFQGKLTDGLVQAILAAETPKRLEDLYLPYKPKKKSQATEAREKGLEPLAEAIWHRDPAVADLADRAARSGRPGQVAAEHRRGDGRRQGHPRRAGRRVGRRPRAAAARSPGTPAASSPTASRRCPRARAWSTSRTSTSREPVRDIPPHRVLAINRGEKENVLRVRIDTDPAMAKEIAAYHLGLADHPHRELMEAVADDALDRLIRPSLDREVRRELTERAQEHAVMVFARNLRSLLLQPPLRGKKVLAIDPGIRTGCKLAALDETGKLLEDAVVFPHGQKKNAGEAKRKMEQLVRKHQISVIAIGNGTACRETEQLVADLIADLEHRRLNPTPEVDGRRPRRSRTEAPPALPTAPEPVAPAAPLRTPTTFTPRQRFRRQPDGGVHALVRPAGRARRSSRRRRRRRNRTRPPARR